MDHDQRSQLYRIFGHDVDQLSAELDIAARHHRELAAHLRDRQPDGLITADGAVQLADLHDANAQRCDRIAATVRAALNPEPIHERDTDPDRH